jgi:F0F1-type ATP synthase assembly protein I
VNDPQSAFRDAIPYLGLGLQLGVTMVFFVGLGYGADEWWGTGPWGVVVGAVLGMTSIIAQLVRLTGDLSGPAGPAPPERKGPSREGYIDEE